MQESIGEESNKIGQLATDPENLWVQNAKGLQKKIFRTNFKRSRFVMQQDQRANNNMFSETGSENSSSPMSVYDQLSYSVYGQLSYRQVTLAFSSC